MKSPVVIGLEFTGTPKATRLIYMLFSVFVVTLILRIVEFNGQVGCMNVRDAESNNVEIKHLDTVAKWDSLVSQSMRLTREHSFCPGRDEWDCGDAYCNAHERESVRFDTEFEPKCKTLWFAGMSEANFDKILPVSMDSYATLYVAALKSVHFHSSDVIQPVLMLNAYGNSSSNVEESAVAKFAVAHGAVVVNVVNLSMQTAIDTLHPNIPAGERVGPFMRMDIPNIIRKKKLFNMSGICERYVLYTDSDVLFPNPISHQDMQSLKWSIGNSALVMYGREYGMHPHIVNTGVMLIDVPAFEAEVPKIVKFGLNGGKAFDTLDQAWMNEYFSKEKNKHKRSLLPIYWNWKVYWGMAPSFWEDVKIIHYHGPKPGRCLENIANCDPPDREICNPHYFPLIKHGICCDYGRTAFLTLDLTKKIVNASQ